ncbi:hypothetical protein IQ265_18330 [Nodosilinea sp. LEGE 06152]|uniref:DUF6713 family protein n=1 Tax=Nodosilinea sp. LEGE 06152 TaxID=2777966 RepID=UPI00187EAD6C|nr:DUF6713 family protein [Nodosilinea sp. LEGE 06152]MBE9158775.1 hypothetical protein [Nodosilinea sp. LEGE 06152]
MQNLLFYLGFATLMAHELDAMTQAEWRLLFVLRRLPEATAETAFVLVHIPLVAGLLWLTNSEALGVRRWSRLAIAAFLVIHAALHKRLDHHPLYSFDSALSVGLIYGGGLLGLLYLGVVFASRLRQPVPAQDEV